MKKPILEICAGNFESALAASNGGADRIELCENLLIGGTTPSQVLFEMVREHCNCGIKILLRPRFGDFCYTDREFEQMLREIDLFRAAGATEIVTGILKPDGSFDHERMKQIRDRAGNMQLSVHRAFDMCRDPYAAAEFLISLGCKSILTSGQKDNAWEGRDLLKTLQKEFGSRIEILAGAGINAENIQLIYRETGITAFHMSGKETLESPMTFRNPDVFMGLPGISEYSLERTSVLKVERAVHAVRNLD